MNEGNFQKELLPIRKTFGRFSPEQVRSALEQIRQDLDDRPPEVSIGIGDHFERTESWGSRSSTTWVLRPRRLKVLDRLADIERATHVGLVRMEHGSKDPLPCLDVWAGWMAVADIENLTDQEWDRVRDGLEFKQVMRA